MKILLKLFRTKETKITILIEILQKKRKGLCKNMILNRTLISLGIGIDPSYLPSGIRALGEISLLRVREQGDLRFGCGCGVVHTAERRSHEELRRSRGGEQAFLFFYGEQLNRQAFL